MLLAVAGQLTQEANKYFQHKDCGALPCESRASSADHTATCEHRGQLALWLSSQVAFHFEAARKRRPRNRPSHANGCAQVLWSKELIERPSLAHAEPGQEGSVWVESIESLKSKNTDQSQKKTSVNQKILAKPLGHTELSNYEVDIGDEPITEL